jgi:TATA-box binding protein (TBP) (component of TFIID and TFIIIB)
MNIIECGEGMPMITVTNVSTDFNMGVYLNTEKITLTEKGLAAQLNKKSISSMKIKTESRICQQTSVLCFETGKTILTGACFEEMSRLCAWSVVALMNEFGIRARLMNFSVSNISGHFSLGFPINMVKAARSMDCAVDYSKKYSGMILSEIPGMGKLSIITYPNGRGIITGVKTRELAAEGMSWYYPRIKQFESYKSDPSALEVSIKKRKVLASAPMVENVMGIVREKEKTLIKNVEISENRKAGDDGHARGAKRNKSSREASSSEASPYVYVLPVGVDMELSSKFDSLAYSYVPQKDP